MFRFAMTQGKELILEKKIDELSVYGFSPFINFTLTHTHSTPTKCVCLNSATVATTNGRYMPHEWGKY